jgi:Phage phiEco32-like COOH.NH2 ligase-type 2
MKITIGCDPELFVTKDGKYRSAHGLIPGTKEKPHKVQDGAIQVDGCALEFNTDPVDNADDFVQKITSVMAQMKEFVPDYDFAIVPSCRFNGNHFRALPDEAKELGCTPDFSAYTLRANPTPDNKTTMRTASGHIHIGFIESNDADVQSEEHMIRCATLVKQLDAYLGLPSVLYDLDKTRRQMYGRAGAFRPKTYGVEYRVLSNAWLLSEDRIRFVFKQTMNAVTDLVAGKRASVKIRDDTLINTINSSSGGNAQYLLRGIPKGEKIVREAILLR